MYLPTALTKDEFKNTFTDRMIDVTDSAEPVLDIWPYVRQLAEYNIVAATIADDELVEYVYRTDTSTFDHILLSSSQSNLYIVIVVDILEIVIVGYYDLDLNSEYDL